MTKEKLREFREHYFPDKTIAKSRSLMCERFGITTRCARSWEDGHYPVQPWFEKHAIDFDKDGILK